MKEIEKIIKAYEATDWQQEQAALGTVIKVEESAYRRVGARMYVTSSGNWTGGISGGCLEGDALKRAQIAINKNQCSIVVYDTMDDDAHQIGVGLGCNGRIEVLFAPVKPQQTQNPIASLKSITTTRNTAILLQVLQNDHADKHLHETLFSIDQKAELAKLIQVEEAELDRAIAIAADHGKSKIVDITTKSSTSITIFVELIRPKVKVICIGDNYDVNAFVRIVDEMGWEIHVAGKMRKLNREVFDLAESVCSYEEAHKIGIDAHTAVVLMSHDYKTDFKLLQEFLKQEVPYIGMLGPKKRMLKMQDELAEDGKDIDLESLPNLFAPVGLDIGAESPEEIALSIASEIIATLRGRDGAFLRKRIVPIHER